MESNSQRSRIDSSFNEESEIHFLGNVCEEKALKDNNQARMSNWRPFILFIISSFSILIMLVTLNLNQIFFLRHSVSESSIMSQNLSTSSSSGTERYIISPEWDYSAAPTYREYNWTISKEERNQDGIVKLTMLINGLAPGPLIECNDGDTIVVHVRNEASDATSIHWHGIFQNGSSWMDGTSGITQCPIPPGASFTYEFQVSGQAGTYLYRSEIGVQAADGLAGPIVIHSKDEHNLQKLTYDSDRVVLVQDYYHDASSALLEKYMRPGSGKDSPLPDNILINGKNVWNCAMSKDRQCDSSRATLEIFNLEPGKKHRLRFINIGVSTEFEIQIDNHAFAVTEVDGTDVWPEYYEKLQIQPTQRYSIIVTTNVITADTFWLRVRMAVSCFTSDSKYLVPEAKAVINYSGSSVSLQASELRAREWITIKDIRCEDMDTSKLRPVLDIAVPKQSDDLVYIRSKVGKTRQGVTRGYFNQSSWQPDLVTPSLHRTMEGFASGNKTYIPKSLFGVNKDAFDASHELVYQTTGIKTIDVLFDNHDEGSHPLHLHGHKFWVLAQGGGYVDENILENAKLENPLRRDTASLNPFSWMLIRFVADNPGMWALKSANLWHMEAGLSMQFLTRSDELSKMHLPNDHVDLCETT